MGNVSTTALRSDAPSHPSDAEMLLEQGEYVRTIMRRLLDDTEGNTPLRKEAMDALVHYLAYVEIQHPDSQGDRTLCFAFPAVSAESWSKEKEYAKKFIIMSNTRRVMDLSC